MSHDQAVLICCHLLEGGDLKRAYHGESGDWQFLCDQDHSRDQARAVPLSQVMEQFNLTEGNLISVPPGYMGNFYGMYWMMKHWDGHAGHLFRTIDDSKTDEG